MLIISDLRQVEGFRRVHRFPPPIKLTAQHIGNIVESGVVHEHKVSPIFKCVRGIQFTVLQSVF